MLALLLALTAHAQDTPIGAVQLELSDGASVEVFPRIDPRTIEIVVHDNRKPLDLQLDEQRTEHVVDAWAASIGSGTWFMTLYVTSDRIDARIEREDGLWVIHTTERPRAVTTVEPQPASIEDLLADTVVRKPARPPRMPLRPFLGDAWTPRLDPRHVRLPMDPWTPRVADAPRGDVTLEQIDALRKRLVQTDDPDQRTALYQRMALAYQELGLHREARTYFDEVARQRTDWPRATVRLHQADAALATGRWDQALDRCRAAHDEGADDGATLACLGSVSLATGHPAPTPTARALLAVDERPGARLIAAQLLVLDHRYPEALPVLTGVAEWPAALRPWRDATLGDVALALGDIERSRVAWRDVGSAGPLGEIARQRARLVRMSGEAPSTWAAALPGLVRDLERGGIGAAEAHYLAAQIGRTFDEASLSAEHLTELVDHYPELTARSDVPQQLLAVCTRRLDQLHRVGQIADEVAFYNDCWRAPLNSVLIDPTVLHHVAMAFEDLGLWDRALSVQREAVATLTREDREDFDALVQLARLYVRVGRETEALETVRYAERLPASAPARPALDVVAGQAHLALDQREDALRRWARASTDKVVGPEARVRRALLLAEMGRCAQALPVLEGFTAADVDFDMTDPVALPDAQLAVARCLIAEGRAEDAVPLLADVAAAVPDTDWAQQAGWLAGLASGVADVPASEPPVAPSGVWAAALAEQKEVDSVDARIERLRRK